MPRSRQRPRKTSQRYQLGPQRKKPRKASPRWFGPLVLGVMGIGVAIIVWNYLRPDASNDLLFVGLGLIAVGFIATMFWK